MNKGQALEILRQTKINYNTIAKEWDVSRERPSGVKNKIIKDIKRGFNVLDFGCGNGLMLKAVLSKGGEYTGIDISDQLIELAKKKYVQEIKNKQAKFFVGDVLKNKLPDNQFDYIFSYAVLHHIPSVKWRQKFFDQVYRLLKPNGQATFINWNLLNDWSEKRFAIKDQLKNPPVGWEAGDVVVPWKATKNKIINRYLHIFSEKELRQLAKLAGFNKVSISYYNRAGDKTKNGEEQVVRLKKIAL